MNETDPAVGRGITERGQAMSSTKHDQLADAVRETLRSPNVADANLEPANVVDVIDKAAVALKAVALALDGCPGAATDATGGTVRGLTEAVMGVTAALVAQAEAASDIANYTGEVAAALRSIAAAIRGKEEPPF